MDNCIFCKIVKGEAPSTKEFESEHVVAFANIAPVADTHILIVPKTHLATFLDLNDHEIVDEMFVAAQELIEKYNLKDGYKLVFNGGKYQAVPHVHWHLLGGNFKEDTDPIHRT